MAELSAEDRESHVCCVKRSQCRDDHFHQRDVEALIDRHVTAAVTKALNYAANDIELWRDLSRRRSDDTTRDGRSRSGALQRANAYSRAADIVRNQIPRAT